MAPRMIDPDRGPLAELIWEQTYQEVGIPVLLFTSSALAPADRESVGHDPAAALAGDLGLDPARLELFTTDAYLLQCALGARVLPEQQ